MIRHAHLRSWVRPFRLLPLIVSLGCGKSGEVTGKATLNGKAITSGSVTILAADSLTYSGNLDENGTYKIANVASGNAKVSIVTPNPALLTAFSTAATRTRKASKDPSNRLKGAPPPPAPRSWFPLPARYADFELSNLRLTVQPGPNTFDIAIDNAPPKK